VVAQEDGAEKTVMDLVEQQVEAHPLSLALGFQPYLRLEDWVV
tara:strand:+ start:215 stop:343 length:129 start_codon:yes stop_codon:yes gene_type:complete